jgi:hypothetical protein
VKEPGWFVCVLVVLAGCAYAPPPVENPSAPPAGPAGVPPPEAAQISEAHALELAQSKCATEGKHAVARRVDDVTVYDCVAPGQSGNNTQPSPQP